MAISKLHAYKREQAFYERELATVRKRIINLETIKTKLQEGAVKEKKESKIFNIKYDLASLSYALLSYLMEFTFPGTMLAIFGFLSSLDEELNVLEGINYYYYKLEDNIYDDPNDELGENILEKETLSNVITRLNDTALNKYYFQDKLYMLELIKKGHLKFYLKDGKMVVICSSYPLYCSYLEFKEFYKKDIFLPDYYQGKKINIKTLQKQIKIK